MDTVERPPFADCTCPWCAALRLPPGPVVTYVYMTDEEPRPRRPTLLMGTVG